MGMNCVLRSSKISMFQDTPVVMMTSSQTMIDRVKARLVKASGFLIPQFTRVELLKMVFKYLT